jgi:hypothetical protein
MSSQRSPSPVVIPLRGPEGYHQLSREAFAAAQAADRSSRRTGDRRLRDRLRAEADRLAELSLAHSETARRLEGLVVE